MAYSATQSVRLAAHSLLFAALVMTAVLVGTRRGRPRKRWMPLAIGVLMHLVLDAMWSDPETLWWPFLGWEFTAAGPATAGAYITSVLSDVRMWSAEAVGLGYLIVLARRAGLVTPQARALFKETGRVEVPIRPA